MKNKNISIVIPICTPKREFIKIINRLLKQTVLPTEIILINSKKYFDGSTLIIDEIEEKFQNTVKVNRINEIFKEEIGVDGFGLYEAIRKITKQENGKLEDGKQENGKLEGGKIPVYVYNIDPDCFDHGATRHEGINAATDEYVLFMTQDAIPQNKFLIEELIVRMDEQVAITYARQLPKADCRYIEKYTRAFNYGDETIVKTKADIETMGIKAIFCSDVCAMYNKSLYMQVGGFPGKTIFNEDGILAYKALTEGFKVVYAADARVIHSHNYSLTQQFRRNFDLGVSHKQFDYIFSNLSSENEGIKLVKNTMLHLLKSGKAYLIPSLILNTASKYLGYRLGKKYNKLPKELIIKCSMNERYWR